MSIPPDGAGPSDPVVRRRRFHRRFPSERYENYPLPNTFKDILEHAAKGGASSFALAYGVRAGVNFLLHLLRVIRKRDTLSHAFSAAFAGTDALRFGVLLGGYSFLWKFINNYLRFLRKIDDRWNGFVAGAIASISILAEKRERRIAIAQQLFVRALQAIYNAGKQRDIIDFKHGDSLLFALTSAQVLYAYTMQPTSLPPDYLKFMIRTAQVPASLLALNRMKVRGMPIDAAQAVAAIQKLKPTKQALEVASKIPLHPIVMPCELVHPWNDSCTMTAIERFSKVFWNMLPVYGSLHFVPMLLLRTKHLMKDPIPLTKKTLIGTLRSGAFLSAFVMLYQSQICLHRNAVKAGLTTVDHKYLYGLAGFVCAGISIFLEEKRRRSELALFVLPKAAESLFEIWYQHKWVVRVPLMELYMCAAAMAVISSFYQQEPDVLSGLVRKIMFQFFGPN